jgi:hypothetical protein
MTENPILLYSTDCKYSNSFLDLLHENKTLYNSFIKVNINKNKKTNERSRIYINLIKEFPQYIKSVPCIVLNNKTVILSGNEAFAWLNYTLDNLEQPPQGLQPQPQQLPQGPQGPQQQPRQLESFNNFVSNNLSNLNGVSKTTSCENFISVNDFTSAQPLDISSQITTSSKDLDFNIEMERKKQERAEMDKSFDKKQVA